MGKAIATNKIGGDLYAAGDIIPNAAGTGVWENIAMASSGAVTSGEFLFAQAMGSVQLNIIAGTDAVTSGSDTLVITLLTSPTSGGTFDDTIWTETVTGTTAAGSQVAAFIPPRDISECYAKITITSDYDATGDDITAYLVGVA